MSSDDAKAKPNHIYVFPISSELYERQRLNDGKVCGATSFTNHIIQKLVWKLVWARKEKPVTEMSCECCVFVCGKSTAANVNETTELRLFVRHHSVQ